MNNDTGQVDVLVAGGGAAGLFVATRAAQLGLRTVIVDADEHHLVSSSSAMNTGMFPAAGTRWQERADIDDSPSRYARDILLKTAGTANEALVNSVTAASPAVCHWLADACGCEFDLEADFLYPGHSRQRCHYLPSRSGRELNHRLAETAKGMGGLTQMIPARLVAFELDRLSIGCVAVEDRHGRLWERQTTNLVIATGGFAANGGLLERFIPSMADAVYHGGATSTGDAIAFALEKRLDCANLDAYQGHGGITAAPSQELVTWATVLHGGIIVNVAGRRFADESLGYSTFSEQVIEQPGGRAWIVYDAVVHELCSSDADYQQVIASGSLRTGSSPQDLAEATGLPAEQLADTLRSVDRCRQGVEADPFGRTEFARSLAPPYFAVEVTGAILHTQGGLDVDTKGRVRVEGAVVRGLYAAGGAAVGVSGRSNGGYMAGNGLLAAFGVGWHAAEHMAA